MFLDYFTTIDKIFESKIARHSLFRHEIDYKYVPSNRPDAEEKIQKRLSASPYSNHISVIDFKYVKEEQITFEKDICKQLVYEFTIRENTSYLVHNVLVLPCANEGSEDWLKIGNEKNKYGIRKCFWNTESVIESYINKEATIL